MCDGRSATPVASQFVMTASSSRGQLLPAFVTCCYISLRCHGMPYRSAVSICTLIANALVFVKCIDSHIHSSLSLLVAFMALVGCELPMPMDESMRAGETMITCRCFYKFGVLKHPR